MRPTLSKCLSLVNLGKQVDEGHVAELDGVAVQHLHPLRSPDMAEDDFLCIRLLFLWRRSRCVFPFCENVASGLKPDAALSWQLVVAMPLGRKMDNIERRLELASRSTSPG
jgi:hypothetical protein